MEAVWVKWVDITDDRYTPGLTTMWQLGVIRSTTYISDGVECMVLSRLIENGQWADLTTIPMSCVKEIQPACVNFLPELALS